MSTNSVSAFEPLIHVASWTVMVLSIGHPLLRNISLMMAMVNFVGATTGYQLVLFASRQLHVTKPELGLLFSANAAGVVVFGLLAGWLRPSCPRWARD